MDCFFLKLLALLFIVWTIIYWQHLRRSLRLIIVDTVISDNQIELVRQYISLLLLILTLFKITMARNFLRLALLTSLTKRLIHLFLSIFLNNTALRNVLFDEPKLNLIATISRTFDFTHDAFF